MYLYLDKVEQSISRLAQSCTLDSTLGKYILFEIISKTVVAASRAKIAKFYYINCLIDCPKIERFDEN